MQYVSTLMDGELDGDEAGREIARLKADPSSREAWDAYHQIGDAMRGAVAGSSGFGLRFSERLALEPTVLAPRIHVTRKVQTYALSAAASVAAVAVVGWVALSMLKPDATPGELAKAPVIQPQVVALQPNATTVAAPLLQVVQQAQSAKLEDAGTEHVYEYLLAHQGISPTTAIQGVTPYIRTVSSTGE